MSEEPVDHAVVVRDVKMPFTSMVVFMVKWALASIPALVILIFVGVALTSVAAGLGSAVVAGMTRPHAAAASSTGEAPSATDPAVTAYLDQVVVSNVRIGTSVLDEAGVWAELKNAGNRTLKEVDVTIYCLGADGQPVFEKKFSPVLVTELDLTSSGGPLKPGYSRAFGVKLDDAPSTWIRKVRIEVTSVEFADPH